jgi:uncharacterized protein (DUF1800 family)
VQPVQAQRAGPSESSNPAALSLVKVVSRKTHGAQGAFDIDIDANQPIAGPISVEPRRGASHTLIFSFNEPVTSPGTAASTDIAGAPLGMATPVAAGNDVIVTLTGVADRRRVRVALTGVNGTVSAAASIGFLMGDVTNDRSVLSSDTLQAKSRAGQTVSQNNFRFDVDVSGTVSAVDIVAVKSRSGQSLGTSAPPMVSLSGAASGQVSVALALSATASVSGGTITKVEFFENGVKIGEDTTAPYALNWVPGTEGTAVITARATDNASVTATSAPLNVSVAAHPQADAARLLAQATFGATQAEITRVAGLTPLAYLEEQFALAATSHLNTVRNDPLYPSAPYAVAMPSIWKQYFEANDQLRQRVVFALSQIMVISMNNNTLGDQACAVGSYLDMLGTHAFGNFKDLLKGIVLHPAMGEYLDLKGSAKADPVLNSIPNENFARELMQLFSIGTVMLNQDGSVQFANGKAVPTYSENTVKEVSRALSGWNFAGLEQSKPWRWLYPDIPYPSDAATAAKACTAWSTPMEPWTATYRANDDIRDITGGAHDTGAKTLLSYPGSSMYSETVAAGRTPMQDVDSVVDNVFNHPNVGPFIGEQLIQRLVMSNPTGAYVSRVAAAFNNNGSGVRGDMKAVLRAILLDPEARLARTAQPNGYGKLREPVLRFTHLHRAFGARMAGGYYSPIYDLTSSDSLGQNPLRAPSVFNFYHPDHSPAGPLAQNDLFGPEFEITNSATIAGFMDFSKYGIVGGFNTGDSDPNRRMLPDYSAYTALANDPPALVNALNILLMAGGMSGQFRNQLIDVATKLTDSNATTQSTERVKTLIWLILNSPEYSIQK